MCSPLREREREREKERRGGEKDPSHDGRQLLKRENKTTWNTQSQKANQKPTCSRNDSIHPALKGAQDNDRKKKTQIQNKNTTVISKWKIHEALPNSRPLAPL
jgi:hypothetical protein